MKCLVLPCAGILPIDLQAEFGPIPAACLPIGNSIVLAAILSPLLDSFDVIYVAMPDDFPIVKTVCANLSPKIHVVNVGRTRSIGHTVLSVFQRLPEAVTTVTVQAGDAYHPQTPGEKDSLNFTVESLGNRWVTFDLDKDLKIAAFQPPGLHNKSALKYTFAGRFTVSSRQVFQEHLVNAVSQSKTDWFVLYDAVREYFNTRGNAPLVETSDWHDCGYSFSYYKLRRNSRFNERHFNSVTFDETSKIVTKKSANGSKLADEIDWYKGLPSRLQFLTPRIFESDTSKTDPWVQMEYLSGIPLDQLYLYSQCPETAWNAIVSHLREVLRLFAESGGGGFVQRIAQDSREMYVDKTQSRLEAYRSIPHLRAFTESPEIEVNGEICLSFAKAKDIALSWVTDADFVRAAVPGVIHGDLCFSNVIYDMRTDKICLIDPRGSFGAKGIHGDVRYDLAKLYHSSDGAYDHLVNGYFDLKITGPTQYQLHPHISPLQARYAMTISEMVERQCDRADLKLIEGLLFLSMVPLHSDKPQSQIAFALTGLRLVTQAHQLRIDGHKRGATAWSA